MTIAIGITPGQPLDISANERDALGSSLTEIVTDLENEYTPLFKDIDVWWSWYEATPNLSKRNFPFQNASNIVVPLIQINVDAMTNRFYGKVFGSNRQIWTGRTRNEEMEDVTRQVLAHINWAADDNEFGLRGPIYDWIHEMVAIGSSVMAVNWREDVRMAFAQGPNGPVPQPVTFNRGPIFEHIPREQILWDTSTPIGEAPVVVREAHYTWSQLVHMAGSNGWDQKALEEARGASGVDGPSSNVTRAKRKSDSTQESPLDNSTLHDIREIHIDWPILKSLGFKPTLKNQPKNKKNLPGPGDEELGQPTVPLVAILHRKSGKLLHIKAEPYFFPQKPFFDIFYRKRVGRGHSVGLSKKLEAMQAGMSTLLNQSIDARTRANSLWAKTNRRELLTKPIDPRHPIHVPDGGMFEEMNLQSNVLQDTQIFNVVNILSERLTGQADPAFGRESRSGGHPSPATSTLALMANSDQMIGTTLDGIRQQVGKMGAVTASLYQQFPSEDGSIRRSIGERDGEVAERFYFPDSPAMAFMEFDVYALNEALNPQAELQKAITLSQMNVNYWAFVAQAVQVLTQAQQQGLEPVVQIAQKSIEAQTKFHDMVLNAGEIDDVEKFILALNPERNQQPGAPVVSEPAGGQGAAGAPPPAVQGPPLGGPPQLTAGGTLAAPGGLA